MAGEQDKQVKLSFVVDQASVQAARKAISELIVDATKLANVLKGATLGGGGSVLGGGGVGAGSPSPQQTVARNAASGPAAGISGGVTEASKAIVQMGRNTKEAFQGVTEAVRRNLNDQSRDVDAFSRKVSALNRELATLRQNTGGGAGVIDMVQGPNGTWGPATGGTTTGPGSRALALAGAAGPGGGVGGAAAAAAGVGAAPIGAAAGGAGGGTGGGGGGGGAGGGGVSDMMKYLRAAGVFATGKALMNDVIIGTTAYAQSPAWNQQLTAQRADLWGGFYRSARGGDLTTGMAALAAAGVNGGRGGLGGSPLDESQIQSQLAERTTSTGVAGFLKDVFSPEKLGRRLGGEQDIRTQTEIQQRMAESMQNWIKTNPQAVAALQQFQGEAAGQISLQRTFGVGGRVQGGSYQGLLNGFLSGSGGGGVYQDRMRDLQYNIMKSGYDISEYASAFAPLRGALGTKAAYGLAGTVMGGEAGGFQGIGGIAQQAAIGGQGREFLRTIFGRGAVGGLSESAAMGIGGAVAGSLTGGGIATSGLGSLAALQAGLGGGTGGAEDMMIARQAQAGMGAFSNVFSGSLDKYQMGMNFINAGNAFGGTGFGAQGYLSQIFGKNPNLAADIMAGGNIPPELRALGVTSKEQVAQFVGDTSKGVIARATNVLGNETPAGKLINSIQASGGDVQAYMRAQGIHGAFTDRKGRKHAASKGFDEFRTDLGMGLAISQGIEADAAEGEAAMLMGIGAKGRRTGGAGAPGSLERDNLKRSAELFKQNADEMTKSASAIIAAQSALPASATQFGNAAAGLTESAHTLDVAFKMLAKSAADAALAMASPKVQKDVQAFLNQYQSKDAALKAISGSNLTAEERGYARAEIEARNYSDVVLSAAAKENKAAAERASTPSYANMK